MPIDKVILGIPIDEVILGIPIDLVIVFQVWSFSWLLPKYLSDSEYHSEN